MSPAVDAPRSIRVVVVDDHPAVRTALRTILATPPTAAPPTDAPATAAPAPRGIEIVGEAGDGDHALTVAARESPDVVVMDVRMPGRDGLSATALLARTMPTVRVLVLTTFDDDASVFGALEAGATGFLPKNAPPEQLRAAVHSVADGDAVLDPAVLARVMRRAARPLASPEQRALLDRLTEREKDVLWLLAQGSTNPEIAAQLGIGEATAKTHVSNVIAKLDVRDRVQAAVCAHITGFAGETRAIATSPTAR